ncbi:hypothetical protein CL652_01300 [bacterium]|nr:hypothetical protein [bacterium]
MYHFMLYQPFIMLRAWQDIYVESASRFMCAAWGISRLPKGAVKRIEIDWRGNRVIHADFSQSE